MNKAKGRSFTTTHILILRAVCHRRVIFTAISDMQAVMELFFGISKKEFWLSIDYLTSEDYLIQYIDCRDALARGDQLKITEKGLWVLGLNI